MCLILLNVIFHINVDNFVNARVWLIILFCNFLTYNFYFHFLWICSFKIRLFVFTIDSISFKLTVACMLSFFEFLLKCINLYFVEKKVVSWRRNHVWKISCDFYNILQFSFVLMLYVNTFTFFTNSMKIVFF